MVKILEFDDINRLLPSLRDFYHNARLGNLIYGIIHNLNGSLQLLNMNLEILERSIKREKLPPSFLLYFEKCLEQMDRLKKSLDIILYKGEDDQEKEVKPIHLNELMEELIQFFRNNLFFKHQVKLNKLLESRLPKISGFSFDFYVGISNIIQNSIEALEVSPKKELAIITKTENEHILVAIKDTGCGISDRIKPYLFQPFFTTKKEGHLGLGLYITKKLLEKYGTKFRYHSDKGETTFYLTIPIS